MKFSNLLFTTIIQNIGFIIMVAFGLQSFGISLKWIILFGLISFYVKYELTGVIYINSDPLTCFERCGLRNRDGEKVGLHYLRNCDTYHHDWLQNTEVPILTMSSDYNQQQLFSIYGFLQRIMLQTKK